MMKVFLASPATQMHAEMLAGMRVLESFALFAECPWMVRYRPTFAESMLDSGAFSVMTTGEEVDRGAYIAFCVAHKLGYSKIINLDVIAGDVAERVKQGLANLHAMRDAGLDPMPVFHQGEPWSVLGDLASCGWVGLGLQRPMRDVDRFLGECFDRIPGGVKVHGFGLANERYTGRYPFHSVDSATWIYELRALSAIKDQASDVLRYLTQGELLALVVKKYQRLPAASAWAGTEQLPLFADTETP